MNKLATDITNDIPGMERIPERNSLNRDTKSAIRDPLFFAIRFHSPTMSSKRQEDKHGNRKDSERFHFREMS